MKPVKPKKPLVLFMGMFLGACAGGGLIFGAEMLDHSFLGVDEAKEFLELPIFGAISKIITTTDLKTQKMRNSKIAILSTVTGIALFIVIVFNIILGG